MNARLWVLQIQLALHTLTGAVWKLGNSEQTVPSLQAIPHPPWLAMTCAELVIAACPVLPAVSRRLAVLVPVAAACVAAEMLLLSVVHLRWGDPSHRHLAYWLVVAALCAVIVYGRLVIARPRGG